MLAVLSINAKLGRMPRPQEPFRLEVADRLHSAAIHLLRHARKRDVVARQGPARLSALSVLVFSGPMALDRRASESSNHEPHRDGIEALRAGQD